MLESLLVELDDCLFKEISLDWITELLIFMWKSQKYDSILMIVYHATKYVLFISTCEDVIAIDLAKLFFEHVKCYFDIPAEVISDRDFCIMSVFWHEICEIQMIKRCLSTIYHLQTDEQSEVLNYIIKDYLCAYSSEDQTAWICLLSLAQFAYNNSWNFMTEMSSNWVLFDYDCEIWIDVADTVSERRISATRDCIEKLQELCQ